MAIDSAPTAGAVSTGATTDLAAGLSAAQPATPSSRPEDLLQQPPPEQPPDPTLTPEGMATGAQPATPGDYGQTQPAGVAQLPQQLLQEAQGIQQGWQWLQQRDQAFQQAAERLDYQEALLKSLEATADPEALAPRKQEVTAARWQLWQELQQHQQQLNQVNNAQAAYALKLKEAQLEQLAGPMSVELLARKLAAEAPGLDSPEMQQALRQYLVQFDANGLRAAGGVITDMARRMGLQQRAKAGTDQMGGSTSATPPGRTTTANEDLAAGLKAAYGLT